MSLLARTLLALLLGVASACAARDPFEVTREVVLESGTGTQPSSIDRAPDGGYIVTGAFANLRNVVIKTDARGNTEWRYVLPSVVDVGDASPRIYRALAMTSGHWLLCGDLDEGGDRVGLLVELDDKGKLVSRRELVPQVEGGYTFNMMRSCVRWDAGFVLLAFARKFAAPEQRAYWVTSLGEDGGFQWERLITASLTNVHGFSRPRILGNGELIFSAWQSAVGGPYATELLRVDSMGRVAQQRTIDGVYWLVRAPDASKPIRLMSVFAGDDNTKSLVTLDRDFEILSNQTGPVPNNNASLAYEIQDGSIVIFGSHHMGALDDAGIVTWGPDLERDIAEFRFEKPRRGGPFAPIVGDAVPTATANEFATIRMYITEADASGQRPESGMRLAFVRVR